MLQELRVDIRGDRDGHSDFNRRVPRPWLVAVVPGDVLSEARDCVAVGVAVELGRSRFRLAAVSDHFAGHRSVHLVVVHVRRR